VDNATFWALAYNSVLSWQYHPRNEKFLTFDEIALVADNALAVYIERQRLWELSLRASPDQ